MADSTRFVDRLADRGRAGRGRPLDGAARPRGATGAGRVLVVAYAILALAATGRSLVQILGHFGTAPLAYTLSACAAVIYLGATVGLVAGGPAARRLAWTAIWIEFAGVVAVGLLSVLEPGLFPADTVWSGFGRGYGYVPAVLPLLGMAWLEASRAPRREHPSAEATIAGERRA